MPPSPPARRSGGGALAVAAGIFLSRVAGLVRERAIAHYLGQGTATDAFRAALRIPNLLQNLLGEGVLSASFIPVYARLLAEGRTEEASLVARAIGTLLALVASALALVGILAAGPVVDTLSPGYDPATQELTVQLVQIMFPGVVLLVMSAWCLGVLNSHRRFFLSYVSPVLWNTALIATAIVAGRRFAGHDDAIAVWLGWGAVIGSAAQFLVQLPTVIALVRGVRPSLAVREDGVRKTLRAFVPVLFGRGSVQISAYIDQALASYLGKGIVSAMANAQVLYTLPVSLFGMAVSAAELPEMSSATGGEAARAAHLQNRLDTGLRKVTFLVVPSAIAFATIGGAIVALLFQTGKFTADDTQVVWIILCGSAIGLVPSTLGRLLASAFYALGDPKPPLRAALVRVGVNATLGFIVALPLRAALGYTDVWRGVADVLAQRPIEPPGFSGAWFAFGLMAGSGIAAWIEFALLRRWLARRIGAVPVPTKLLLGTLAVALVAGAGGYGASALATHLGAHRWMSAIVAIGVFGVVYLGSTALAQIPEAHAFTRRLLRRRSGKA